MSLIVISKAVQETKNVCNYIQNRLGLGLYVLHIQTHSIKNNLCMVWLSQTVFSSVVCIFKCSAGTFPHCDTSLFMEV